MGSAAAYHLAARGLRVLGLERFGPAHDKGSSHGGSRITRQSYFEDPAYVPLLLRAYELWDALAHDSGRDVITLTGGVMIGPPASVTVAGSRRSAESGDLPHEMLDAVEIRRRFPTLLPADDDVALYERNAGFLRPEVPSPRTWTSPAASAPTCASASRCAASDAGPDGVRAAPTPAPTAPDTW
jgi:sarcosine oxidase